MAAPRIHRLDQPQDRLQTQFFLLAALRQETQPLRLRETNIKGTSLKFCALGFDTLTENVRGNYDAVGVAKIRNSKVATKMARINVTGGYMPGAIGAIVSLHARHYAGGLDLGLAFEAKIAMELSSFLMTMDPAQDLLLLATVHGTIVGSLAIDGHGSRVGEAQLRWFVVHPLYDPDEVCSALLDEALGFASERNYRRIVLWTKAGSDVALKVAGDRGFQLVSETENRDWGRPLRQQRFELVAWNRSGKTG
ncbi:MAG TPA: GNAT family N-acetyltransferase [Chthoniobacterales bacterium]